MIEWVLTTVGVTLVSTYITINIEKSRGVVAPDIHKPNKPRIPRTAGPAFMITLFVGFILSLMSNTTLVTYHILAAIIAGAIGLYDDFRSLRAPWKVTLLMLPSLPVLLSAAYIPRPYVPLVGPLRIHVLYPLLLPLAYTVSINTYNMIDTHNGVAVTAALTSSIALLISSAIGKPQPPDDGFIFALFVVFFLISYFPFNMYPSKIFNGNSGSFILGSLVASQAILLRREYLALMLYIPLIINGFSILTSIGGFKNKESVPRPVVLTEDVRISPNKSGRAPVTLVQLLVLRYPLTEKDLIKLYSLFILINTVFSLITYYILTNV
ncbi:MAG: hypothetical protein QN229_03650 [Desulfurococcaceae archaeon TW002]